MSGDSVEATHQLFQAGMGGAVPTSPHQLDVREIGVVGACKLNREWHSRLPRIDWSNVVRNTHYVCFGFYFYNEPFGVAIWSSPVAQNRLSEGATTLELRRMALSPLCPPNTASRTLSIMTKLIARKFPEITKLISYQDTEVHQGTIYKASGWSPGAPQKYQSWTTGKRRRNIEQAPSPKIRWERDARKAS